MAVLLHILVETFVITVFLWIGKSVMKAQVTLKTLGITALAGALASQVPYLGTYLSFGVICFFLWKMARIDIIPDGLLMLLIGKGAGLIIMIYGYAYAMDHMELEEMSPVSQIPIYLDDKGTRYYADGEQMYYIDENQEKVFVDAETLFGVSEIIEVANHSGQDSSSTGTPESVSNTGESGLMSEAKETISPADNSKAGNFSAPFLSDSVVRGEVVPFELFVPKGWKVSQNEGEMAIRHGNHTYIRCRALRKESDNNTYLREEVSRVLSQYSPYEVASQDIVTLDGKKWARIQMANNLGDQVLLLTHADRFGCYSLELNGSHEQLSSLKDMLNRVVFSFNFPPSTYTLAQVEDKE